ncbi:isochorismatase hydrolase [Fusarium albosuccineum]|uniref:Isochorismatase hydrolase n=1 Tax=Fusarium albosuccineum TaxID=1237068 RepID=A0A8H4LD97_9HYPO|nr:isochorismatase hydrolase [Fusarium albosuccineum]
MSVPSNDQSPPKTAVVLIDPYNDFLHPEGKLYGAVKESLLATNTVEHLKELVAAARSAHIPIYYALHQTWDKSTFNGWKHQSPSAAKRAGGFEAGTWGVEILEGLEADVAGNGDVIVSKHWNSSGFANTDLDYQLRQREITDLVLAGMAANTCPESTARYARELSDATAGFSTKAKDAATDLVWPLIAERVTTVGQWASSLDRPVPSKV